MSIQAVSVKLYEVNIATNIRIHDLDACLNNENYFIKLQAQADGIQNSINVANEHMKLVEDDIKFNHKFN